MPDEPLMGVSKVGGKGLVQIPFEIRQKLDLRPVTRMIVMGAEDAVILQRADSLVARRGSRGIMSKLRYIFSRVPIRNMEE